MDAGGTAREKSAVASVAALDEADVGIGEDARAGFRRETDEGIVFGAEDERRNGDAVDDAGAGGAIVVVIGVAKAAVARDDFLIEFADGANGTDAVDLIYGGKEFSFVAEAAYQVAQKMPLVGAIEGLVQSVGAGGEINGRAHGGDSGKQRLRAPLAGELEHEIAAHGVADQRHALKVEARGEVMDHGAHVSRAAGVVERGSERFAASAVAHIHAHDVHAGGEGTRGNALHVAGVGRALEAVHQHRGEPRGVLRLRLPVTVAENAAGIGGIYFNGFGDARQAKRGPGKKVADDGLQMAVREPGIRFKGSEPGGSFRRRACEGTVWHCAGWHDGRNG